jgi:purine nucleoside permease
MGPMSPDNCMKLTALPAALCLGVIPSAALSAAPVAPRVMVVATFEIGKDSGDKPGEFQFWVEREKLAGTLPIAGVDHPLRFNDQGVYGAVSGTTVRSAADILTLGLDPSLDLTKTYWLINGIAGVDPADASVGAAAWARHVVDGDIAYEIDSRETPAEWPYGIVPIGGRTPNQIPGNAEWAPKPMSWTLNPSFVQWAFEFTRDTVIPDSDSARKHRALYTDTPEALKPARVLLGDSLGSCRYWHGTVMTRWANDWTRLHTGGKGNFVMTNMEDQGICLALTRLARLGKVDFNRVLFLRTGSNFCTPHPGQKASQSMTEEYSGMLPALEAAHAVGSRVVREISGNWTRYENQIPSR